MQKSIIVRFAFPTEKGMFDESLALLTKKASELNPTMIESLVGQGAAP